MILNCSLISIAAELAFGIIMTSVRKEERKDLDGLVANERGYDVRGVFHFSAVAQSGSRGD